MNYRDLSKTQKRVVDAMIEVNPALASRNSITRIEVEACWDGILSNRKPDVKKIGYPSFITKGGKLGRGIYVFPGPNVSIEDDDFYQELSDWGIELDLQTTE